MATPYIYAIARDSVTGDVSLIYSEDTGSTWSEITTGLDDQNGSGSLFSQDRYIYFTHGDNDWGDTTGGHIGRHEHGTTNTYKIDVEDLLSLASVDSAHWAMGPIRAVDENNVYFGCFNTNSDRARVYHFNGNWSSPQVSDFTLIFNKYKGGYIHDMLVRDTNDIYLATSDHSTYDYRSVWHYNGTTFSTDTSLGGGTLRHECGGFYEYNNEIYAYIHEVDENGWGHTYKIFKGSVGSWSEYTSFTRSNPYGPTDWYDCDSCLWIDEDTGDLYLSMSYGNNGGYPYLGYYDGTSWDFTIMEAAETGSGGFNGSVRGFSSDQVFINYYIDNSIKIWDGSSFSETNISGYGNVMALLPFDSSPYLDQGPSTFNRNYYLHVPMTWNIKD